MRNTTCIARSVTTGKYHIASSPNVTLCNHSGQSRSSRNRPATATEIEKAADNSFCKKCFRNGKPIKPIDMLRYHVTGAIERGEAVAIEGIPATNS